MADDKTPAADNPYTQIHVVQSGDTLSKISTKVLRPVPQDFSGEPDVRRDLTHFARTEAAHSLTVAT